VKRNLNILSRQAHLPSQIQFDDFEFPRNEFAFSLKGRFLICQEWIHRPFLYYVLSKPQHDPYLPRALILAQKCIESCTRLIPLLLCHNRNGATWIIARRSFSSALLILATVRADLSIMPSNWKMLVGVSIRTLRKWEGDALDLKWTREVLQDIFHNTCDILENRRK
jgi:hypothetical protein